MQADCETIESATARRSGFALIFPAFGAIHRITAMNLLLIPALSIVCAVAQAAPAPKHPTIDDAIAKDDLEDVRAHLAANPQSANQGGKPGSRPPLEQAILRNRTRIAHVLIDAGANPNAASGATRTPLHLAVERNNPEIAAALLKAGARPNERDNGGWTPLHHTGAKNLPAMAGVILKGGADPMTLSALGGTPLHEAAASGGAEIIRLFLDHRVDPKVKSKDGKTALDIAREFNNRAAMEILEKL
ncbi:MAG: hypothetical protein FJ385_02360 [Verrucomicrobia bacterium]|nr:hypothetical protein [Verrucomicrobiota bacterium]